MSIKRHPALQPLSRDHVIALFHAHQLMWLSTERSRYDATTTVQNFQKAWEEELLPHFGHEERLLPPLAVSTDSIERLLSDHSMIRQLVFDLLKAQNEPDVALCLKVGSTLEKHVRWEEHELFPEVERSLSVAELAELQEKTKLIDVARKH